MTDNRRPFDLQKALNGFPLVTRDGREATGFQRLGITIGPFNYMATVANDAGRTYDNRGRYFIGDELSNYDLFLLETDDMKTKKTPLQESQDHWYRLATGTAAEDEGVKIQHCALCKKYHNDGSATCSPECPIVVRTGKGSCRGTPYSRAGGAYYDHGKDSRKFRTAAMKFYLWLLECEEPPEPEPEPELDPVAEFWNKLAALPDPILIHVYDDAGHAHATRYLKSYNAGARYPFICYSAGATAETATSKGTEDWWSAALAENRPMLWDGGECPLPDGVDFRALHRSGVRARHTKPSAYCWTHREGMSDIIALQILGGEPPTRGKG